MLIKRFVTAMILFALVVWAMVALKPLSWVLLVSAVTLLASIEWARLSGVKLVFLRILYAFVLASILLVSMHLSIMWLLLSSVVITALLPLLFWAYSRSKVWALWLVRSTIFRLALGVVTLIPPVIAIGFLNFYKTQALWLLAFFLIVFGADVGAYFVGTRWGKRRLLECVSPKKSWEGVRGGFGLAIVMALAMGSRLSLTFGHFCIFLLVSLLTVVASVIGDLNESLLKRQEGLKDSGHWLPGHGGLLDRIDSLTTAAPLFALCVLWFGLGG